MINFWATWCEPCKIETPWLVELQKKYGDKGLQILGVAVDDAGEKAIADFAHKMQMNYPVLLGTEKVADFTAAWTDSPPTSSWTVPARSLVLRRDWSANPCWWSTLKRPWGLLVAIPKRVQLQPNEKTKSRLFIACPVRRPGPGGRAESRVPLTASALSP